MNTALSGSPRSDRRYGAFTGLRNDVGAERFETSDLVAATNVDIDKTGQLARRPGVTSAAAGAFHSIWSDNVQCLVVEGGLLKRVNSNYSRDTLRLLSSASWMKYAKVHDRVYFSNGVDTGIVENGVARTWGVAAPTLPGASVTVGNMPAGTYQFTMTYTRADGQESGAPLAGIITVPDWSGLVFALPTSLDPGVTTKSLYLSAPDGEMMYLALGVANSTASAAYMNDANELSLPLITQFLGPAPAGQIIGYYSGRMFVASGDTLYPSEPLAYELFDVRKGIPLDGRITLFAPIEEAQGGGLFVGTDRSCGALFGKDEFQYVPKIDYGAIEGASVQVEGALYSDGSSGGRMLPMWLTTNGVCVGMPGMEVKNITRSKYQFSAAGRGAAVFMPESSKLIFTSNL